MAQTRPRFVIFVENKGRILMIYYYSGCGNSRLIAQKLSAELGERLVFIPEAARAGEYCPELEEGESLGFVWPVYCWAPPRLVSEFVSRLQLKRKPSYTYMVATYGDDAGLSEKIFRKSLRRLGLELDACQGLIMPETYVNFPGMGLDSREVADSKIRAALSRVPQIAASLRSHEHCSDIIVGKNAWLKSRVLKPLFYRFLVTDRYFSASDACTGCGLCARLCPLENIVMGSGRPHWTGSCTTCNACYHNCPSGAISFGRMTKGKGQYRAIRDYIDKG